MTLAESVSKDKWQHDTHKNKYTGVTEVVKWREMEREKINLITILAKNPMERRQGRKVQF